MDTGKSKNEGAQRIATCQYCAASHDRGNCPAYGAKCCKCNGRNHYAQCCFKSKDCIEEKRVRHVGEEEQKDIEPRGGGGTNQILIRGGSARRSNPLPFHIPFWRKRYPFYIPFIAKRYPFHIPTLGGLVLIFM